MIELSRTIFFSRSDARPYISRSRETFFYFPPFLFPVSYSFSRAKSCGLNERVSRVLLRMAYLSRSIEQQRLLKTHDPPRRAWNKDERVFRTVSIETPVHAIFSNPPILILYVAINVYTAMHLFSLMYIFASLRSFKMKSKSVLPSLVIYVIGKLFALIKRLICSGKRVAVPSSRVWNGSLELGVFPNPISKGARNIAANDFNAENVGQN